MQPQRPQRKGIVVTIDASIRTLPQFDPDLESAPPDTVLRFCEACERAVIFQISDYARDLLETLFYLYMSPWRLKFLTCAQRNRLADFHHPQLRL